jgi:hypothetical protein
LIETGAYQLTGFDIDFSSKIILLAGSGFYLTSGNPVILDYSSAGSAGILQVDISLMPVLTGSIDLATKTYILRLK